MNHSRLFYRLPWLLVVARFSIAWTPFDSLNPFQIINEKGEAFEIEPVKVHEKFTFQLKESVHAKLVIHDKYGSLMATRVLDPEWERLSTQIDVRRWPKGHYEITVESEGQIRQFPLTVE